MALDRKKENGQDNGTGTPLAGSPKYPHPKILALDLPEADVGHLRDGGYSVVSGTFGQPFKVAKSSEYFHVAARARLPNYTEQEVVIADLEPPEPSDTAPDEDPPAAGIRAVWASCKRGIIDPRPRVMGLVQEHFDRIYAHGGVFIFLLGPSTDPEYVLAESYPDRRLRGATDLSCSNYDCLSILRRLTLTRDYGRELQEGETEAAKIIGVSRHLGGAGFLCSVRPNGSLEDRWLTLATNKYGDPVAGAIAPSPANGDKGWIFLLPRLQAPGRFIRELLDELLPNLVPRFFPHAEGSRWTRRVEYEFPEVLDLRAEIEGVEAEARKRAVELEQRIEQARHKHGFLHELLTSTGDELVTAVIRTLKLLGFQDVRNVDEEEGEGQGGRKREDIQVWDTSPVLLGEVKGIANLPREAGALQVTKYLRPRMKEWERTDIDGISIINHQRRLPALDRQNDQVFQDDVITNAQEQGFGLLTTWDLFRLARGFIRNGWTHDQVRGLFYRHGRIDPVPYHYDFVGVIDGFWEQPGALGLRLAGGRVAVGDVLAYELKVDFIEETVTSLRLDNDTVTEASGDAHVGVATGLTKTQARDGTRVFRIKRADAGDAPGAS
jgi:hypothetical protein